MFVYAGEDGFYVLVTGWIVDCYFTGTIFGPHGHLSFNEFMATFLSVKTYFLLYEGVLIAVKG